MRFCRSCGSVMNEVLSFSNNKRERYNKCKICHNETPKNKLTDKELEERFGRDNTYGKKVSKY
jgi:DNA-directed RNA polymerase subunit M/transcription elongation factor TFIIS